MLKRIVVLLLAAMMVFFLFSGCELKSQQKEVVEPKIPPKYVLIIGNSHSIDAFWLLHQAWSDCYPDTEFTFGILHYGGGNIDEHVEFLKNGEEDLRYYKNANGKWDIDHHIDSQTVLEDEPWEVIMMQPAKEDLSDETLNKDGRHELAELVDKYVKNPHEYWWHISWPSPNDETFFSPDYIRQPPAGYKKKLTRLYGFDPVNQFTVMLEATKKNILNDDLYTNAVCSGAAIMHAMLTQGQSQLDLWRDYTHLSDYGRLMVGYALVAQLTRTPITNVGVEVIPIRLRHRQNKPQGKLYLTEEMRDGIVAAANYALENPWVMPEKTN